MLDSSQEPGVILISLDWSDDTIDIMDMNCSSEMLTSSAGNSSVMLISADKLDDEQDCQLYEYELLFPT